MKRLHQYSRSSRFRIQRLLKDAANNEIRENSSSSDSDEEINLADARRQRENYRNIAENGPPPRERIDAEFPGDDMATEGCDASSEEPNQPRTPPIVQEAESDHPGTSDNTDNSAADSDNSYIDGHDSLQEDDDHFPVGGPQAENAENNDDELDEDFGWDRDDEVHIYDGAPINLGESMLAILAFYLRHNISLTCLTDLLTLIDMHCREEGNRFPKSLHVFKKKIANIQFLLKRHYYCSVCFQSVPNAGVPCQNNHGNETDFFIQIPVVSQLKALYKRPGFKEKLNYKFNRNKRNDANIEDIYDGAVYKHLSRNEEVLSDPSNISLMWNTDGGSIFKSSKSEIWPFYLTIQELSYNDRTKISNVLLAGLWFGRCKPAQATFLQPIRDDLLSLRQGINVSYGNNPIRNMIVKGIVICGTGNLPAKAKFLNMKSHNSTYGCVKCQINSVNVRRGLNVYPFRENLELRTQQETNMHAREAMTIPVANGARQDVFGVKGVTVLSTFVYKCVETVAVDEMHCVFCGLVRALLGLWFDPKFSDEGYSLCRHKALVNARLLSITPPCFVQRLTRNLDDVKHWKAHEMKSFLFYHSVVVLGDLMSELYSNHHMLLVLGIYLLHQRSISAHQLDLASQLLTDYVAQFEDVYGIENMTCNLHQLLHLSDNVRNFGPLWVTSCFPYEDINGKLKKLVKGTRYSELQICSGVSMLMKFAELSSHLPDNSKSQIYVRKIFDRNRGIKTENIGDYLEIVGKYVKKNVLPAVVQQACLNSNVVIGRNYYEFYRLMKYRMIHTSNLYDRATKTNSNCVKFKYGEEECFGFVDRFLKVTNCNCVNFCRDCEAQYFAIIRKYETQLDYSVFENTPVHCMHTLLIEAEHLAIPVKDIICMCYVVKTYDQDKTYLIEPVNLIQAE